MATNININLRFTKKVNLKEKVLFTRALATMISAGLPIVRAFEILAKQTTNESFKEVIQDIIHRLEEGEALSGALAHHRGLVRRRICRHRLLLVFHPSSQL